MFISEYINVYEALIGEVLTVEVFALVVKNIYRSQSKSLKVGLCSSSYKCFLPIIYGPCYHSSH